MAATQIDVFGDVSAGCDFLAQRSKPLAHALKTIERPHIRKRKDGFAGLFRIIVEQQVSVPSAQAIWKRCCAATQPMNAKTVAGLGEEALRAMGLTRQKAHYVHQMALAIGRREFSFRPLPALDDDGARDHLTQLKGVGPWSAGIYLLFCEGRIDIWPPGDIALEHAYGKAAQLEAKPTSQHLNDLSQDWAPWRGLAAHILWTYYAHIRGRTPI